MGVINNNTYGLLENRDIGEIYVIAITTPIERWTLGYYLHSYRGTREEMEQQKMKIIKERRRRA